MPPALDQSVKDRVRSLWFDGETRKNIAAWCGIGAGSVTNIISELKNGLEESHLEWIRELAVQLKKEGTTLAEFVSMYRRHNFIKKLGANEEQIESLIVNLLDGTRSIPIEKTADLMNMLYELSESEFIPLTEVPAYVKKKMEEKNRLEEEIQKAGAILDRENIDNHVIEEFKKLKEEVRKYGLSIEDPSRFASILQAIDRIGNDPGKFVRELARLKSQRQEERRLKNNCKIWESRAVRYKQIIPLCERLVQFGVGFHELIAFHAAIIKKADMENLPFGTAAYSLMEGIDMSSKLADMKGHLNETWKQIQMVNLVSARQKDAIIVLMKLLQSGTTEDQILKTCRSIEANGAPPMNSQFSVF